MTLILILYEVVSYMRFKIIKKFQTTSQKGCSGCLREVPNNISSDSNGKIFVFSLMGGFAFKSRLHREVQRFIIIILEVL